MLPATDTCPLTLIFLSSSPTTYNRHHAITTNNNTRCELLPVRLDGCGLVPSHLDALLTARQAAGLAMPKLLYTIPTGEETGQLPGRLRCSVGVC